MTVQPVPVTGLSEAKASIQISPALEEVQTMHNRNYRTGQAATTAPQKASLTPLSRISGFRKSPMASSLLSTDDEAVKFSSMIRSLPAISPWARFKQILGFPCAHQTRHMRLTKCGFETTTRLTGIDDPCGTKETCIRHSSVGQPFSLKR